MSEYHNNSIFWVETEKIQPNPFQPRRDFEPGALEDLADSIRQYGVLQPLVVTRKESLRPDNDGLDVYYELIAGERRLRASKIAGLHQVPVIIRKETDDKVKLELAIIENLQREDLNPIDRALAFEQLHREFGLTHVEIGKRMGKSRVYVSNSMRLLALPQEIQEGLKGGRITEGHTRPLLMLSDRPEEQNTLYREIMTKRMSVRDAEKVARSIAQDRVRKKEFLVDPKIKKYEQELSENLGTRVHIEPKEQGGQITIDYFSPHDLDKILASFKSEYDELAQKTKQEDSYLSSKQNISQTKEVLYGQDVIMDATGIDFETKTSSEFPFVEIPETKEERKNIIDDTPLYYQYRKKSSHNITTSDNKNPLENNKDYTDWSYGISPVRNNNWEPPEENLYTGFNHHHPQDSNGYLKTSDLNHGNSENNQYSFHRQDYTTQPYQNTNKYQNKKKGFFGKLFG